MTHDAPRPYDPDDWWDNPPAGTCAACARLDHRAIRRINRHDAPVLCDRCFEPTEGRAARRHRCVGSLDSAQVGC